MLMRLGVTEQDQQVIPEMPIDESRMARASCLRDAAPKVPDCLAQVFEICAAGSPPLTPTRSQEKSGDLAPLGFFVPGAARCPAGLRPAAAPLRRIAALWRRPARRNGSTRRGMVSIQRSPLRSRAQNAAQRRYLHGEIALLDRLAGPSCLDQNILRKPVRRAFQSMSATRQQRAARSTTGSLPWSSRPLGVSRRNGPNS